MTTTHEILIAIPLAIIMFAAIVVGNGFKRRMKAALRR